MPARAHGHSVSVNGMATPTYRSWSGSIQRCTNPENPAHRHYGGRGIKVCARWLNSFANFLADMGECPAGKSLDRFPNNDGDYEPGNCRWATPTQQRLNSRNPRRGGKPTIDLAGKKFSRLLVLSFAECRRSSAYWNCVCDCGRTTVVSRSNLVGGAVRSCGCSRMKRAEAA